MSRKSGNRFSDKDMRKIKESDHIRRCSVGCTFKSESRMTSTEINLNSLPASSISLATTQRSMMLPKADLSTGAAQCCRASADLELRVEHRPPAGALEVASEPELDLGAIERRRRQMAPERLDLEHCEGVARHPHHVVEPLRESLDGGERIDPLDTSRLRHAGI